MANDVTIVVEASLGDTLIKLDLAKHAVSSLGKQSEETALQQDAAALSTVAFADSLGFLGNNVKVVLPMMMNFTVPIIALPLVAGAAAVAVVALADAIGTLVAIVADFVAPASLLVGLLGGLGAGFLFAGVSAAKGGGALQPFADKLATLHSMFDKTGNILGHVFLPYLLQLASAAQKALLFIDRIAREPLAKAMQDMATQGIQMLNKFVEQVAHVVARPIRLAFQIAFGSGPGGNEVAQVVQTWWHQLTTFFFGFHPKPLELRPGMFRTDPRTVDGIFQPLIDWFNRHHFTKQGIEIGHGILAGFIGSNGPHRMGQFLIAVMVDAVKTVVVESIRLFVNQVRFMAGLWKRAALDIISILGPVWDVVKAAAVAAWNAITSFVTGHIHMIAQAALALGAIFAGPVVAGVEAVVGAIQGIIGGIETAIHAAETLANAISSIPNPFGGGGDPTHGGRAGARNPTGVQGPHVRGGVVVAHVHLHGIQWHDAGGRARIVHDFMAEMGRQQGRLADGH